MSHIIAASSVLVMRGPDLPEFLLVQRSSALRFFGGFHAFPGGKVSPVDRRIAADSALCVTVEPTASDRTVAAVRELFEETGILLARRADGTYPDPGAVLDYTRRKLLRADWDFDQALRRLQLQIHARDLMPLGTLVTPPFVPTRFDTQFFLTRLPPNQTSTIWPGELTEGIWTKANDALAAWTRGDWLVSPPTVAILEAARIAPAASVEHQVKAVLEAASQPAIPPIYFAPLVRMIPLDTQSLPPSTHTNAFLMGRNPAYLIDPGTAVEEEQGRLFAAIDEHLAAGGGLNAVVLTHHHPDHIGAANRCAERYRVPILAHPAAARRLEGEVAVSAFIEEGQRLDLGRTPDGRQGWFLEALLTPGHAPGHLAFWDPYYRLLFAGDLVSTLSSVVIAPPDGDLALYLASLRRLQTLPIRLLLPAHGGPTAQPGKVLANAIAHRAKREGQLRAALRRGPQDVEQLAQTLYKGLLPSMMRFARLQIEAGLAKLLAEGRVECEQQGTVQRWYAVEE